jgi:hypothetical protein
MQSNGPNFAEQMRARCAYQRRPMYCSLFHEGCLNLHRTEGVCDYVRLATLGKIVPNQEIKMSKYILFKLDEHGQQKVEHTLSNHVLALGIISNQAIASFSSNNCPLLRGQC